MAIWGVAQSFVDGPTEALFSDSVPSGGSNLFQYAWAVYVLATIAGPAVSIILFRKMGDEWDMRPIQIILFLGISMECLNACIITLYDDRKALSDEERGSILWSERDSQSVHDCQGSSESGQSHESALGFLALSESLHSDS